MGSEKEDEEGEEEECDAHAKEDMSACDEYIAPLEDTLAKDEGVDRQEEEEVDNDDAMSVEG